MRLVRTEDKSVTRFNRYLPTLMTRNAVTGDDVIELPLRAVGVIGISRFPWWDPTNLDVKRMALHQISRERLSAERLGNLFARAREFPLRRRPDKLLHVVGIHFAHKMRLKAS